MKTKKIYRPEDPKFVMKPIIMDIACRLNSIEIGGNELAALEWLTANPDELGNILRTVYRYCV
nr:MAG TPA: hypothetical protein [Caudoviricetes sp.]